METVHVGDARYTDYTMHPHDNKSRKINQSLRRAHENLNNYMSAGTSSRSELWEHIDINSAILHYFKNVSNSNNISM